MLLAIKYTDVFYTVKQWTDRNLIQYRFYLGLNAIPRKICPLTELSVGSAAEGRKCRGGFVRKAPQVRSFRTGKDGHDTPPRRQQWRRVTAASSRRRAFAPWRPWRTHVHVILPRTGPRSRQNFSVRWKTLFSEYAKMNKIFLCCDFS